MIVENKQIQISKEIIVRFKQNDERAFELIFNEYKGRIKGFIINCMPIGEDVESCLQEVFIKLWNNRSNIDLKQNFEAYLFKIARNYVVDELRKKVAKDQFLKSISEKYDPTKQPNLDKELDYLEIEQYLLSLIDKLPERRRHIFKMSRFEGYSYREIARKLAISENTVDTQIRKSLNFLRKGIEHYVSFIFFIWLMS
ncbi:RNA polymerase sigma-70 factor [Prolixibacteraceae bacterium JC049]|nr:RNA polymerase sigma-70 factor [Prolixibacteraceae bacterium JC049]